MDEYFIKPKKLIRFEKVPIEYLQMYSRCFSVWFMHNESKKLRIATYWGQPLNRKLLPSLSRSEGINIDRIYVYFPRIKLGKKSSLSLRVWNLLRNIRNHYLNINAIFLMFFILRNIQSVRFYYDIKNLTQDFENGIKEKPTLFIFIAGQIVPNSIYNAPGFIPIIYHAGLLPQYRGCDTIFWQVAHFEKQVGGAVLKIQDPVDSGPVLLQKSVPVEYTAANGVKSFLRKIYQENAALGSELLIEAVNKFASGDPLVGVQQDIAGSPVFKPAKRQDIDIFFQKLSEKI